LQILLMVRIWFDIDHDASRGRRLAIGQTKPSHPLHGFG
jgi:hypothetical protein